MVAAIIITVLAATSGNPSGSVVQTPQSSLATTALPPTTATLPVATTASAPPATALPSTSLSTASTTTTTLFTPQLIKVTDGDTIVLELASGKQETVQLIGVNAPESGKKGSKEATECIKHLLASGPLSLEYDVSTRDDSKRLLAYVYAGSVFVNQQLVVQGVAEAYSSGKNRKYEQLFADAQDSAKFAMQGLWATATTQAPTTTIRVVRDIIVHVTATGAKYHRAGCQYLRLSDYEITLAEAKAQGYDP